MPLSPSTPENLLFDRALLARHRIRALRAAVDGADFLLRSVVEDTGDRLAVTMRCFETGVALGDFTGQTAAMLQSSGKVETIIRADGLIAGSDPGRPDLVIDEEALPFAEASLDLVISPLALHFVNDLPGALIQIRRALKPDGLLLAAFLGGETLTELRQVMLEAELACGDGAAPRVLPVAELRDAGSLLQRAGFALPVTDRDRLTVRYDTLFHLIRDLRAMGATNILAERDRRPVPRALFLKAAELYQERFSDPDGRIRATFEIISLSGWAPSPDQQKPLAPGSAKMRLADALKTEEISAGETADPADRSHSPR
ncbi:MAG: SAM-dependent methyltransferase [Hyphomicrobiales bacterium]|nr:MAG: SAM-dependent methyltransferase [Hyphomicrobiales bacterium]